ncbi:MAG: DUF1971 domain-containing protein, partial [Acidimicrobiales bacterium]|nr:DUF1971 domain-containing protein [Acidimicrobiales bacterium]
MARPHPAPTRSRSRTRRVCVVRRRSSPMNQPCLPDGLEHVRTTDIFDNDTVPAGLLRAHRVADGVWGRLVVHS